MRQDVFARFTFRSLLGVVALVVVLLGQAGVAIAQEPPAEPDWASEFPELLQDDAGPSGAPMLDSGSMFGGPINASAREDGSFTLPDLTERENLAPALQMVVLLTVLSLAPAVLILCTSFTRIVIVLSLLRQAMGTQSLPPNQVLVGLALFMTFLIMAPTWNRVHTEALQPYLDGDMTQQDALDAGLVPLREFMISQIQAAENDQTVLMFQDYAGKPAPETWGDVDTLTLIPSYVLSELKVGFLMGFKVYLPFLVIDMVIAAVLISMGMMMLPPVLISLPFKLLLFVLVDGWHLIVGSLMESFRIAEGAGAVAGSG